MYKINNGNVRNYIFPFFPSRMNNNTSIKWDRLYELCKFHVKIFVCGLRLFRIECWWSPSSDNFASDVCMQKNLKVHLSSIFWNLQHQTLIRRIMGMFNCCLEFLSSERIQRNSILKWVWIILSVKIYTPADSADENNILLWHSGPSHSKFVSFPSAWSRRAIYQAAVADKSTLLPFLLYSSFLQNQSFIHLSLWLFLFIFN